MKKIILAIAVLCLLLAFGGCNKTCDHTFEENTEQAACNASTEAVTRTCTKCGESFTKKNLVAGHSFGNLSVSKSPTCSEEGEKSVTCSLCGTSKVMETIPKIPHEYTSEITTPATCATEGVNTFSCTVCDDSYTEAIPTIAHSYGSATVTQSPTCTQSGTRKYTCTDCSYSYTESVPVTRHQWINATCTTPKTCSVCHVTTGGTAAHTFTSKDTTPATCTKTGVRTYTCTVCSHSYTESISSTGHKWVDATCTKPKTCSNCKATSGSANGHSYSTYNGACYNCNATAKVYFKTPSLPASYSYYGYYGTCRSTCKITDISASFDYYYSYSDEVSYTVTVTGTCTYVEDSYDSVYISYVLYDSSGNQVESGSLWDYCYQDGSFSDTLYFYDLKPGKTYTLVLYDYE